jgi:hypothetical protein
MTTFGIIFLPLCLYFWRSPARLLELVMIGAVFSAAAVIVVGGYGVMPALVPAALFINIFVLKLCFGERYPAERLALSVMFPFIAIVVCALASSFIMPRLFEGDVMVWPQKSFIMARSPLAPNSGNYTQDMYLLANALLAVTAAPYLTREGFNLRRLLDAYFVASLLVVFISLWQFAGNTLHIWYPTDFFLSNPGWAQLSEESIGTLTRLNGPFSEPSALAAYLCGTVSAAGWMIFNGDRARLPRLALICGLAILLLCTSTTGYIALAIMIGLLLLHTFIASSPATRRRVLTGAIIAGTISFIVIATIPILAPSVANEAEMVVTGTLNKNQTSSYNDRTTADRDSLRAMAASDFLGVGWGSTRSSSLLPGLCAAIGAWGLLGLLWFTASLYRHLAIAHRLADASTRSVMRGCNAAILGTLISAFISAPTISSPDFYLLLALLVATAARVRHEAQNAQKTSVILPRSPFGMPTIAKG